MPIKSQRNRQLPKLATDVWYPWTKTKACRISKEFLELHNPFRLFNSTEA